MINDPRQKKRSSAKKDSGAKKKRTTAEAPPRDSQPRPQFDYSTVPRNRLAFISAMRASLAMLNVLEDQYEKGPFEPEPWFQNPPDDSLDEDKLADLEQKIDDMEHRVKMVSRRLNECRKGQMILMERVEELQNSMHKSQLLNVVKELLYIIPTEKELSMLQKIKQIEALRQQKNREIHNREKHTKILSKTLGRAEAIITDTTVLKRPKRVVIVEDELVHFRTDDEKTKFSASYARKMDGVYYKGIRRVAPGPYFDDGYEEKESTDAEELEISATYDDEDEYTSQKVLDNLESDEMKLKYIHNHFIVDEKLGHSSKDYKSEGDELDENEPEMTMEYEQNNLNDDEQLDHSSKDYKSEGYELGENEPEMKMEYEQNNLNDDEQLDHSSKDYKSEGYELGENEPEMTMEYEQNNLNDEQLDHSFKDYKSEGDELDENEPEMTMECEQNNFNDEQLDHSSKDYKSEDDELGENEPEMKMEYEQNNLNDEQLDHSSKDYYSEGENEPEMTNVLNDDEKLGHTSKDYKSEGDLDEHEPKN